MEKILSNVSERSEAEKMTSLLEEACTIEMVVKAKDGQRKTKSVNQGLPQEITSLIKKRNEMRNRNKISSYNKIELNLISQLVRQKLGEYNKEKEDKMINEIIENTGSTKIIKNKISAGKPWITCLKK